MAITINIYYSGTNGRAREFAKEMIASGIVEAIRAEKGNSRYEYFFPMDDEETVLLIDSWTDQEALDKHHASPMMTRITELREKYDLHMKVERYVSDVTDPLTKDAAFIRNLVLGTSAVSTDVPSTFYLVRMNHLLHTLN